MKKKLNEIVFLGYAEEDEAQVKKLYNDLETAKLNPWMKAMDLTPGKLREVEIKEAIRKCKIFIACVSKTLIDKTGFIQKELGFAIDEFDKRSNSSEPYFIPLLLEDVDITDWTINDFEVSKLHYSKIFEPEGKNKLMQLLKNNIQAIQETRKRKLPKVQIVHDYIEAGELKFALEQLENIINNFAPELHNNITMLKSKHNHLFHKYTLCLVSTEEHKKLSSELIESTRKLISIITEKL